MKARFPHRGAGLFPPQTTRISTLQSTWRLWSGRAWAALWEVWVQPTGFLLPALHLFQDVPTFRRLWAPPFAGLGAPKL